MGHKLSGEGAAVSRSEWKQLASEIACESHNRGIAVLIHRSTLHYYNHSPQFAAVFSDVNSSLSLILRRSKQATNPLSSYSPQHWSLGYQNPSVDRQHTDLALHSPQMPTFLRSSPLSIALPPSYPGQVEYSYISATSVPNAPMSSAIFSTLTCS